MTSRRQVSPAMATLGLLLAACQATGSPAASVEVPSPSPTPAATERASAEPAGLNLVTIGDSIPYAQDDCGGCPSFTTLFSQGIEQATGRQIEAQNLSTHDNLTGKQLVERIRTDQPIRTALASADVVIVSIGHYDTPWNSVDDPCDGDNGNQLNWSSYTGPCVVQLAQRHGEELGAILSEITALRAGRPTAVRVLSIYNDQNGYAQAPPESIEPVFEVVDAFHAVTCPVAEAHGAGCVDVYRSFNGPDGRGAAGDLLAGDYTNPSAKGQQRIADLLTESGLAPLAP